MAHARAALVRAAAWHCEAIDAIIVAQCDRDGRFASDAAVVVCIAPTTARDRWKAFATASEHLPVAVA
jgi:N-acetylmuramoyl-L-alanine amidase CwlA